MDEVVDRDSFESLHLCEILAKDFFFHSYPIDKCPYEKHQTLDAFTASKILLPLNPDSNILYKGLSSIFTRFDSEAEKLFHHSKDRFIKNVSSDWKIFLLQINTLVRFVMLRI